MKKRILIGIFVLLAAVCIVGVLATRPTKIIGEDGLITKAREEITDLAEDETIEMSIAGKSTAENNRQLFWIITGNEYQMHRYYALEVTEAKNGAYEFVKLHKGNERAQDIFFANFAGGYSFVINNPKCESLVLDGIAVPVAEIPFVYSCSQVPNEYYFLDADGDELH